jgi:small-conductance mechanosensitive channel
MPDPAARLVGFGENGLEFTLEAWIARHEQNSAIRSEVALAVYHALGAAGIEIPLPQRDVHVRPGGSDSGTDQG